VCIYQLDGGVNTSFAEVSHGLPLPSLFTHSPNHVLVSLNDVPSGIPPLSVRSTSTTGLVSNDRQSKPRQCVRTPLFSRCDALRTRQFRAWTGPWAIRACACARFEDYFGARGWETLQPDNEYSVFLIVPMMLSLSDVTIVLFLHEQCVRWRRPEDGRTRAKARVTVRVLRPFPSQSSARLGQARAHGPRPRPPRRQRRPLEKAAVARAHARTFVARVQAPAVDVHRPATQVALVGH
jgi:hypothetical protein